MSTPNTIVAKLNARQGQALRDALNRGDFQFRKLQHAFFQARGHDVVVSYYRSGKLVVQGKGREAFLTHYLEGVGAVPLEAKASSSNAATAEALPDLSDSLGSDEAGKGDSFGGIVVAAVGVPSSLVETLLETKVADSKTLADERMRVLAPWLRDHFPHAQRCLSPTEYNQAWQHHGRNVNHLLAELHRQCLVELASAGETSWQVAVVDRFSAKAPVATLMQGDFPDLKVVEVPRAEQHAAVAAASVLAREAFLCQMDELSQSFALDLPLGSGAPVPKALRAWEKLHGTADLGKVAKLHFKNIQRFLGFA